MKIYELAWYFWDDSMNYLFTHPKGDKTQEEFRQDCSIAFKRSGATFLNESGYPMIEQWIHLASDELVKMGYEIYRPINVTLTGDFMCLREGSIMDIDVLPSNDTTSEEFFGKDNVKYYLEKMDRIEEKYKSDWGIKNEAIKSDKEVAGDAQNES